MPKLSNPRQEAFALAIVAGAGIIEAYIDAGFAPAKRTTAGNSGRKLLANKRIAARVHELKVDGTPPIRLSVEDKHKILAEIACCKSTPARERIHAITESNKLEGAYPTARERDSKHKPDVQVNIVQPGSPEWSRQLQAARQLKLSREAGSGDAVLDHNHEHESPTISI